MTQRAKLNAAQVVEIYRRGWAGESKRALGLEFGVHHGSVNAIMLGRLHRSITRELTHPGTVAEAPVVQAPYHPAKESSAPMYSPDLHKMGWLSEWRIAADAKWTDPVTP